MSNLPLWMGRVPDYEVVNGNMQIAVDGFVLAMPIQVFLAGCAKGRAAIVKWESNRQRDADVIQFPKNLSAGT